MNPAFPVWFLLMLMKLLKWLHLPDLDLTSLKLGVSVMRSGYTSDIISELNI
jgi:hypothetical protein